MNGVKGNAVFVHLCPCVSQSGISLVRGTINSSSFTDSSTIIVETFNN